MASLSAAGHKNRLLHPALCIPLAFLLLLGAAWRWYPPLWQPSYAPASQVPLFQQAAARGVDINHAGLEELTLLPGIGPKKAQAILDYRVQNGPFTGPDDLLEVPGIGPATLAGFQDELVFL